MDLQEVGLGWVQVAGSCERISELLSSKIRGELLDSLKTCELCKQVSALRSYLVS